MMTSLLFKQLDSEIKQYEATIKVLETAKSKHILVSKNQILDVLIARDAVQVDLKAQNPVPVWNLLQIEDLDNRLKQQSDLIVRTINLAKLRSLINPPVSNWWWFLDESPFHPQNHRNWLWQGLSIFLLTISFAFGTSVYSAWFTGGLDALGSSFASAQGVATLFLGSRLFATKENKPLAQVLDCKGKLNEADNNWQNCKKYANPSNSPEEDSWLHLANQRLKPGGKPSCDTEC